jgi:imidazolonepropionase-like amidohydrolase
MWLTDLRLIDTATGTSSRVALELRGGRVARIDNKAPGRSRAVSLGGAYVLPGLISCHTHLQALYPYNRRDEREDPAVTYRRAAAQARAALQAGITTVRCLHEQHAVDIPLRDAIASGRAVGPRILAAGRALTVTGGHGDGLGCRVVDGEGGFLEGGRAELESGADHLKVFASGGLARSGESLDEPEMSPDEMRGAVAAAAERGTYVVAHAASSRTIQRGLDAGIRSFEHAYRLDRATAERMASLGAILGATLVVTHLAAWKRAQGFDEASIERSNAAAERHLESVRHALAAGVTLVNSTDFPPGSLDDGVPLAIREMELLVQAGASPLGAIQSATLNAAALLRRPELGRIVAGGPADLLAVDASPVEDVAAMRRIALVIQGGRIVRAGPARASAR